jgi:acetyltransferase-like isoleucine patch superfamily enzyme
MKNLHIIGTGGLAKELIGYIEAEVNKRYSISGCWGEVDFNNPKFSKFYRGSLEEFKKNYKEDEGVIVAIANNRSRESLIKNQLNDLKVNYETYIHPSCEISPFSDIGVGCLLAPQVIICGDAELGDHTFLNTECVIGHDSVVLSFNCLFPKVEICGDCYIEKFCTFGISSVVLPGIRMKEGSKLDAMSILRESINESAMFVGNPAKPVKIYE